MDISSLGFQKKTLPAYDTENALLAAFAEQTKGKNERERNEFAAAVGQTFTEKHLLFPGNYAQHDFWYLVQLFAIGKHLDTSSSKDTFFPEKSIHIENVFFGSESTDFLSILKTKGHNVPDRNSSRQDIDDFLSESSNICSMLGLGPNWKLRLIEWNEILRLQDQMSLQLQEYSLQVNGHWESPTGEKLGLFTSSRDMGGAGHIDAIWNETKLCSHYSIFVLAEEGV